MEKNKVEEIMENYKKELEEIDKKYEVKTLNKPDTTEIEEKIKYEKEFIAKLEFEGKETNAEMIERAKQRLKEAIDKKLEIDMNYKNEKLKREEKLLENNKLKNSKVILESGREVKMSEKDELDKADLKNKAIRELTSESKNISQKLLAKKIELENKRKEWQEFKYEFEKDENGKTIPTPTNKEEVEKIHAEYDDIKKEMVELNKMQEQCEQYLFELKSPTKENKEFMENWSKAAKKQEKDEMAPETKETQMKQQKTIKNENIEQKNGGVIATSVNENIEPKKDEVTSITINENAGEIYVSTKEGVKTKLSLEEVLEEKKAIYKRLDVKKICSNIEKGKIKALLLQAKVNPAIIKALNDKEAIKEYISCLNEKRELPFELVHDLRNSKLGLFDKMKMWVHARAEDKIPGTKISFASRLWNKNRAIEAPKQKEVTEKKEGLKDIKVENENNRIEKNAAEIMKNTESEIATEVKQMTEESQK